MAAGSEAAMFWNLFEELELKEGVSQANDILLTSLLKFIPAHILNSFVEDFRCVYQLESFKLEDPDSETDIIVLRQSIEDSDLGG